MEKVFNIKIDITMDGQKIGFILKNQLKLSSAKIRRIKREKNGILLNGVHAIVVDKVSDGDVLVVNINGKEAENIAPVNIPLDILLEDEDILVINKTGTMPVHPSRGHITDTIANAVMYHLADKEVIHIITRLDRETSGIVLIAKNSWSASLLSDGMKNGEIKKEYIAIVNGIPVADKETISAPIKRKEEGQMLRCVSEDGKEAVTIYEKIRNNEKLSLIRLYPVTGRTHQLRVHMSYIGNPIYGDSMYGAIQTEERTRLHCSKIIFPHPVTGEKISINAPVPDDFEGLV